MSASRGRVPVLYLGPWVDYGGTAKGTVDWFKWLNHDRFAKHLITTQTPSQNRLLAEVERYAEEVWHLPDFVKGGEMPEFILDFIDSRGIEVVHIMNSRLGFDLLPDMRLLKRPPVIVVQLHVEEDSRRGYVRYVSTRYGNIVDAFSVTSRHLARAMSEDYDIDPAKCRVIYTGVDAEEEFAPARVEAPSLGDGLTHILYLGRLVEQKDPLLMVTVAERLRARTPDFQIHVVAYGNLEADTREAVSRRGLDSHVVFHGPTSRPAEWFAACDLHLMTSVFEGIPYVLFEAMAMAVPTVAPSLPGTEELAGDGLGGRLIAPRDDADAYAEALAELIADPALRKTEGSAARELMHERFSLARMAREHEQLYDELLATRSGHYHVGVVGLATPGAG